MWPVRIRRKDKRVPSEGNVFSSDIFGGEIEELDRSLDLYKRMLKACGVSEQAQANIFGGTLWRILQTNRK